MSNLTLVIVEGQDAGREFPIGGTVLVGRDPGADVVIADTEISSRHASFAPVDGGVAVEDLGSTNGTFVNRQRLTGTRQLQAGDRIQLGATVVEVRGWRSTRRRSARRPRPFPSSRLGRSRSRRCRSSYSSPVSMRAQSGPSASSSWSAAIRASPTSCSTRTPTSPPPLQLLARRLRLDGPGSGSTNGTIVNGHRLDYAVTLSTGDRVEIGNTVIDIRVPGQAVVETPAAGTPVVATPGLPERHRRRGARQGLRLVSRGQRNQPLREPGEIYGFLGPNGAGKSTTVLMLTTLLPPSHGTARIAGYDVTSDGGSRPIHDRRGPSGHRPRSEPQRLGAHGPPDGPAGDPEGRAQAASAELIEREGLTDAADRAAAATPAG